MPLIGGGWRKAAPKSPISNGRPESAEGAARQHLAEPHAQERLVGTGRARGAPTIVRDEETEGSTTKYQDV